MLPILKLMFTFLMLHIYITFYKIKLDAKKNSGKQN